MHDMTSVQSREELTFTEQKVADKQDFLRYLLVS